MAVFGLNGWFGSLFFRGGGERAKLTEDTSGRDERREPTTPDTALQLATVWACVRLLSETIGTLPLGVYRKNADGGRQGASDHRLYRLLHDSPNADQTAAEFWEACVASICLWGNFYAEKMTAAGKLSGLNVLRPDLMTVKRDRNGARVYSYSDPKGHRELSEDEVFHVRGFGVGGDVGLSPIRYAMTTIGLARDTDSAALSAFRNSARPAGWLMVPGKATPEQKADLKKTFIDPITGPTATARAGILEQGMEWKEFKGMPVADMQLLQGRSFNVEELCRWFRVPPFMVGHTEKSTSWGTGLEQQMIGFLTFSLRPYLTRIEQAVKKQLVPVAERASVYAEFNLEGLMRADSVGRAALYASATQNGWMLRREIRRRENLPEQDGDDFLTVQSNLVRLSDLGAGADGDGSQGARSALINFLGLDQMITEAAKAAADAALAKSSETRNET